MSESLLHVISSLGWTIVHSIWQCGIIAFVLYIFLASSKNLTANFRSIFCVMCLFVCASLSIITFLSYYLNTSTISLGAHAEAVIAIVAAINVNSFSTPSLELALPYIVLFWVIGCIFLMFRNLIKLHFSNQLRTVDTQNAPAEWTRNLTKLCRSLSINKALTLRLSKRVNVPCVVGHFKPIILLPISMIAGTPMEQIEFVLLHELGHIHRNDYIIGLVQIFLKTIYFFNPGVLMISSKLDAERENACDDIVMSTHNNPLSYAKTLQEFATMNKNENLAISIQGKNNKLLPRIKRLFGSRTSATNPIEILCTTIGVLLLGAILAGCTNASASLQEKTLQIEYLPINRVVTIYPKNARNESITGYCIVEYAVTKNGATENHSIIECSPSGYFESASLTAAEKFQYAAKTSNGSKTRVEGIRNKFIFSIEN